MAPDSDHAPGHVVAEGTGVGLLISYSFGDQTVVVRPHNNRPTVTCTADLGGSAATFEVVRHAAG